MILPAYLGAVQKRNAVAAWNTYIASLAPVLWLKLTEASGATAADSSGNGLSGAYNSVSAYSQTPLWSNMLGAVSFSSNTGISVAHNALLNMTGNVTTMCVLNFTNNGGNGFPKLIWKPTNAGTGQATYLIFLGVSSGDNKPNFRVTSGSSSFTASASSALVSGTRYILIGRRLGAEVSLWVNGSKVATAAISAAASLDTASNALWSGKGATTSDGFAGIVDELAVWSTGLSDSQIAAISTSAGT